jgi:hypothetical protein
MPLYPLWFAGDPASNLSVVIYLSHPYLSLSTYPYQSLSIYLALSKALNCLVCCRLGQQVNLWQIEMGWPDIHWLVTRDKGGLVAAIFEAWF